MNNNNLFNGNFFQQTPQKTQGWQQPGSLLGTAQGGAAGTPGAFPGSAVGNQTGMPGQQALPAPGQLGSSMMTGGSMLGMQTGASQFSLGSKPAPAFNAFGSTAGHSLFGSSSAAPAVGSTYTNGWQTAAPPAYGLANKGSKAASYSATRWKEDSGISVDCQDITAMKEYADKSIDMIRQEDYEQGRKPRTDGVGQTGTLLANNGLTNNSLTGTSLPSFNASMGNSVPKPFNLNNSNSLFSSTLPTQQSTPFSASSNLFSSQQSKPTSSLFNSSSIGGTMNNNINQGSQNNTGNFMNQNNGLMNQSNTLMNQNNGLMNQNNGLMNQSNTLMNQNNGLMNQNNSLISQQPFTSTLTQNSSMPSFGNTVNNPPTNTLFSNPSSQLNPFASQSAPSASSFGNQQSTLNPNPINATPSNPFAPAASQPSLFGQNIGGASSQQTSSFANPFSSSIPKPAFSNPFSSVGSAAQQAPFSSTSLPSNQLSFASQQTQNPFAQSASQPFASQPVSYNDPYLATGISFEKVEPQKQSVRAVVPSLIFNTSKPTQAVPFSLRPPAQSLSPKMRTIPPLKEPTDNIPNFIVSLENVGKIVYLEPVSVGAPDRIDKTIRFVNENVEVADEPGTGLNRRARVYIENVFPYSRLSSSLIKGPQNDWLNKSVQERFIYQLKNDSKKKFVDYDIETGMYVYEVIHF